MLPALMAAVSIAGSLTGAIGGINANKDARKSARVQARMTYAQRMEEIRKQRLDNEYTQGYNVAAVGASGILNTGSSKRYMMGMQQEMSRDIAWRKNAALQERKSIRAGAPGGAENFAIAAGAASSIAGTISGYKS